MITDSKAVADEIVTMLKSMGLNVEVVDLRKKEEPAQEAAQQANTKPEEELKCNCGVSTEAHSILDDAMNYALENKNSLFKANLCLTAKDIAMSIGATMDALAGSIDAAIQRSNMFAILETVSYSLMGRKTATLNEAELETVVDYAKKANLI